MEDDFWTAHIRLFDGQFRYFDRSGKRKIPVWGKLHVSEERYFDMTDELVPISTRQGTRTYVMLEVYVLWPKLIMTVGLYKKPKQLADTDPVIGKSLGTPRRDWRRSESAAARHGTTRLIGCWCCGSAPWTGLCGTVPC